MDEVLQKPLNHDTIQALLYKWLMERDYYTRLEHKLSNGKIADIYAMNSNGACIIEVKPRFMHRYVEEAYGKYQQDCKVLVLAVGEYQMPALYTKSPITWGDDRLTRVGIWLVRADGLMVIRTPEPLR